MELQEALKGRRSIRAFLPDEVPKHVLESVFASAQHAPSWCNIQPWRVIVTSGESTRALARAITTAAEQGPPEPDFSFPADYPEPYRTQRIACGKALYSAMGVAREDREARHEAWMRNYRAFDAPHVALIAVHRAFGYYGVLDVGCFLQSLLLSAFEKGVSTCAQASLASYPFVVRKLLSVPDELAILCGVAMGYEDVIAKANQCVTTRSPVSENVVFV